eukprot:sb/3463170/
MLENMGLTEAMKIGIEMTQFAPKFDTFDPENTKINTGMLHKITGGIERFRKVVDMLTMYSLSHHQVIQMIQVVRVFHQHASDTGRPVLVGRLSEVRKNYKCHIPEHPLSFNPKQFSLKEYQYRMEPEARRILQLPWANRTDEEVHRVWYLSVCLSVSLSVSLSLCLSLSLSVSCCLSPLCKYSFPQTRKEQNDWSVELRNSTVETHENYPKLTAGKDFGHVALLHMARRTASIVCVEDTEFVVMDRRGNGRAVYRALLLEHKRKKSFLKSMDVFNGVEDAEMTLLTDHTRINEYLPMTLIGTAEHGHPWVYIVMEGVANVALTTDIYTCSKTLDETDKRKGLTEAMKIGIEMTQFAPKFDTFDPENTKINTGMLHKITGGIERFRKVVDMLTMYSLSHHQVIQMIQVVRVFHQHASDTGRPVLVGRLSEVRKNYKCHIPEHPLSFNPKQFSLKEYQYRMEPEARRILQLPWANRTDEEVHRVWYLSVCLSVSLSVSLSLCLSLSLSVSCCLSPLCKYSFPQTRKEQNDWSVELRNSTVETHENYPKLTAGKDFGHVALLHMARRTASIVCVEDTEFVVMDRRGNGRAVYRALLLEHKRKKSFLK